MSECQSQNNNCKIRGSKEPIIKMGLGGLSIARSTGVAFITPTKIEKTHVELYKIVPSFNFIVNEVSCKYFDKR